MLSDELKTSIIQGAPNDFTSLDTGLNSISKLYENQWYLIDDDKKRFPVITLQYSSSVDKVNVPLDKVREQTDKPTESIDYVTGTTTYDLSYDHATEILSVKGAVSGIEHTFGSSEYQLVGDSQVQFLGPTYPDDGTVARVNYNVKWVIALYGGEYKNTLIVTVRTRDYTKGDSSIINGLKLAHTIMNDLYAWFNFTANITGILFTLPSDVRDLSGIAGPSITYRLQFDIEVRYVYHKEVKIESIEDVQSTIAVEP